MNTELEDHIREFQARLRSSLRDIRADARAEIAAQLAVVTKERDEAIAVLNRLRAQGEQSDMYVHNLGLRRNRRPV